jgi:hypothetical protein
MSADASSDKYCMWTGRSFTEGGTVTMWPVCEPDPKETILAGDNKSLADCAMKFDPLQRIDISSMKQPNIELLIQKLIGIQIDLTNALTTMADSFNKLAESNQILIQAMAGEEGAEEVDRYQTL